MSKRVSFIHAADLHLGKSFHELGRHGASMRKCILDSLSRLVDAAIDRKVDLVLLAGDTFDSAEPAGEAVSSLARAFERLAAAGVRVCAIPGTHDPPRSNAYKKRAKLFTDGSGAVLLTPEEPASLFDHLDLAVCAWFPSPERVREWIGPPEDWHRGKTFKVGMIHGSALSLSGDARPDDLVPESILSDPDLHYLALGHHHGCGPVSNARMPAYYSGSTEMLAVDQRDAGHVLHVTLEQLAGEVRVDVTKVRTGVLRYERSSCDVEELASGRDIRSELFKKASPELFLDLVVEGVVPLDAQTPDWQRLEQDLSQSFFKLRVIDKSSRSDSLETMSAVPENSVMAEFMRIVQQMTRESEGPERKEWEMALRLGVHYLAGSDQDK